MLQELASVAARYRDISPRQLVMMATSVPAKIARLGDRLGTLAPRFASDILVIKNHGDTPYETVVSATPADVQLVAVAGVPIYEPVGRDNRLRQSEGPCAYQLTSKRMGWAHR